MRNYTWGTVWKKFSRTLKGEIAVPVLSGTAVSLDMCAFKVSAAATKGLKEFPIVFAVVVNRSGRESVSRFGL